MLLLGVLLLGLCPFSSRAHLIQLDTKPNALECEQKMRCYAPKHCEPGDEHNFERAIERWRYYDPITPDCGLFMKMLAYSSTRLRVYLWGPRPFVRLVLKDDKVAFGCTANEYTDEVTSDVPGHSIRAFEVDEYSIYCEIEVDGKGTDIIPSAGEEDNLALKTDRAGWAFSQEEIRKKIIAWAFCDPDHIMLSNLELPGSTVFAFDDLALIQDDFKFVCREGYSMTALLNSTIVDTDVQITCNWRLNGRFFRWYVKYGNMSAFTEAPLPFSAGCRRREKTCTACSNDTSLLIESENSVKPEYTSDGEGCFTLTCAGGGSYIVNGGPTRIGQQPECKGFGDYEYGWFLGDELIRNLTCPKEANCHETAPLICDPADCSQITGRLAEVECTNTRNLRVNNVSMDLLFCDRTSGRWSQISHAEESTELPDGAVLTCEDWPAVEDRAVVTATSLFCGLFVIYVLARFTAWFLVRFKAMPRKELTFEEEEEYLSSNSDKYEVHSATGRSSTTKTSNSHTFSLYRSLTLRLSKSKTQSQSTSDPIPQPALPSSESADGSKNTAKPDNKQNAPASGNEKKP